MATRRKKPTARRATNRRNPRRRTAIVRASSNRRANRVVRRSRRRNPQLKQLIMGGAYAMLGAMAQGAISSFIPIKGVGIMGLAVQWGAAWLTAMVGEKLLPGGSPYFAAGAAAGAAKSTFDYFVGNVGGLLSGQQSGAGAPVVGGQPAPAQLPAGDGVSDITYMPDYYVHENGMGDIVPQPEYWPGY